MQQYLLKTHLLEMIPTGVKDIYAYISIVMLFLQNLDVKKNVQKGTNFKKTEHYERIRQKELQKVVKSFKVLIMCKTLNCIYVLAHQLTYTYANNMLSKVLSAFHILRHLILRVCLKSRYYYPYFTNKGTESYLSKLNLTGGKEECQDSNSRVLALEKVVFTFYGISKSFWKGTQKPFTVITSQERSQQWRVERKVFTCHVMHFFFNFLKCIIFLHHINSDYLDRELNFE